MFSYRLVLRIILPVCLALILAACTGGEYRRQEKYYLVTTHTDLPFWQNAQAGLFRAAAEIGISAEMVGPTTFSPQEQKTAFDELVASDDPPAGIMVSVSDEALLTPSINAAIAKGINVITIEADAPDSNRLAYVGIDNYSVGVQSAEITAQDLRRAGTVIVYSIEGQANVEERLRGYREVFDQFPAIRIIDVVDMQGDATVAFDRTKEILGDDPFAMDAFVCLEAIACPEIADVLMRNAIKDKVVIAMDADERTLDWINRGLINATVAQRPYTMAYTGLRMLADWHRYPPAQMDKDGVVTTVPDFVDTGVALVTRENVAEYLEAQASADEENVQGTSGE